MSSGSTEASGVRYPCDDDTEPFLADLAATALASAGESGQLRRATLADCAGRVAVAAAEMSRRFVRGGRMFTVGDRAGATAAATLAGLFAHPPVGQPLAARSLAADPAMLVTLGNDVGFELVFARQLIARAGNQDMAVATSTNGGSADLLAALREAKRRGMYTVGLAGHGGGAFAESLDVDVCLAVHSQSAHRVQESQAVLGHRLWAAIQDSLGYPSVPRPRSVQGPALT